MNMKRRILPALLLSLSVVVVAPSCQKDDDKPKQNTEHAAALAEAQKKAEDAKKRADEAKLTADRAEENLKTAEVRVRKLEKELADAKVANKDVADAQKMLADAQKEYEKAKQEYEKARQALQSEAERRVDEAQQRAQRAEEKVKKLEEELAEAKKANQNAAEIEKKLEEAKKEAEQAKKEAEDAKKALEDAKKQTPEKSELEKAEDALKAAEAKAEQSQKDYDAKVNERELAKTGVNNDPLVKSAADMVKELINTPEIQQFWKVTGGAHKELEDKMKQNEQALEDVKSVEDLMKEIDGLIAEEKWTELKDKVVEIEQKAGNLFESASKVTNLSGHVGRADALKFAKLETFVEHVINTPSTTTKEGAIESLKARWNERKWKPEDPQLKAEKESVEQLVKDAKSYLNGSMVERMRNGLKMADEAHGRGEYNKMIDTNNGIYATGKASSVEIRLAPSIKDWEEKLKAERKILKDALWQETGKGDPSDPGKFDYAKTKPLYDALGNRDGRMKQLDADVEKLQKAVEDAKAEVEAAKKKVEELKAKGE